MRILTLLTLYVVCTAASVAQEPKPALDEAYRRWDKGLKSANKEDQLKVLRDMLPNKDDIAYLFPKHKDKLWPLLEKGNKFLEESAEKIAKEFARGGQIKNIKVIDVRKDKYEASGSYKRLLAMIPADVPVFDIFVQRTKGSGGGGTYFFHKGRWFWIKDADVLPEFLEKL